MDNNFQKMQQKAIEIRNLYSKTDPKQWSVDQVFMGMTKDLGNLSKLLMVKQGYRDDLSAEVDEKIAHELSDLTFSLFVLADKLDVNLEKSFWKTMEEIEDKLDKDKG